MNLSKPIVVYNKEDFYFNQIFDFYLKFFDNVLLIKNYNVLNDSDRELLSEKLQNVKDSSDNEIRILFFVKMGGKGYSNFYEYIKKKRYRCNIVFFNVQGEVSTLEALQQFNVYMKGTSVFGWLFGDKDSDNRGIEGTRLYEMFLTWIILLESGALSFQSDIDLFYSQQNWRDRDQHLLVLKSMIIYNADLVDFHREILFYFRKLLELFSDAKQTNEHYKFSITPEFDRIKNDKMEFNFPYFPQLDKISSFTNYNEFEKLFTAEMEEFISKFISPLIMKYSMSKSADYKNISHTVKIKSLEQFKENIRNNFSAVNTFNFSDVISYIKNTIDVIKEKLNKPFLCDNVDLINLLLEKTESNINNIIKYRKQIKEWMSKRNKTKLLKLAIYSSILLYLVWLLLLYYFGFSVLNLNILIVVGLLSTAISGAFWIWKYFSRVKYIKRMLNSEKHSFNKKIRTHLNDHMENISLQMSKVLNIHWEKKILNSLIVSLQVVANGTLQLKKQFWQFYELQSDLFNERINHKIANIEKEEVFNSLFRSTYFSLLGDKFVDIDQVKEWLSDRIYQFIITGNKSKGKENVENNRAVLNQKAYPIQYDFLKNNENAKVIEGFIISKSLPKPTYIDRLKEINNEYFSLLAQIYEAGV